MCIFIRYGKIFFDVFFICLLLYFVMFVALHSVCHEILWLALLYLGSDTLFYYYYYYFKSRILRDIHQRYNKWITFCFMEYVLFRIAECPVSWCLLDLLIEWLLCDKKTFQQNSKLFKICLLNFVCRNYNFLSVDEKL